MADSTFKVTIITPDGTVYENKDATMLVMDTRGGQMGIMANHVPLVAALQISALRVKHNSAKDDVIAVNGGFMEFNENAATVVADSAELPTTIDVARAEKAKERSEKWVEEAKQKHNKNELARAEVHLRRAINRLNVSQMR